MDDLASDSITKTVGLLDPKLFLAIYPHSSAPCHSLYKSDIDNCISSFEAFSSVWNGFNYKCSCPVPLFKPTFINKQVMNGLDPALSIVKEKKIWGEYKAKIMKYCLKKDAKNFNDLNLESSFSFLVSENLALLANHLSKDPDEFFDTDYNLYFNGGNIACCNNVSGVYLVAPYPDYNSGTFVLENLGSETKQIGEVGSNIKVNTNTEGNIYQIEAENNIILTRQRKKICLYSLEEDEGMPTINREFYVESDVPFFSMSLHKKFFCTMSAERTFQVFDVTQERPILTGNLDCDDEVDMSDKWCASHILDENNMCCVDRTSVNFLDLREKTGFKRKWTISQVTELCEEIFCVTSGSNGAQYLVTSHQLLCLDPRYGFVKRWTHGVTHSPTFISVLPTDNCDNIFIGSQRSDCVVFIENNNLDSKAIKLSQPYSLPSLQESLHLAQYNGVCLGNAVSSRFSMSTTGLCSFENDNIMTLLRITSVGDVFSQKLVHSYEGGDTELQEDELLKFEAWEECCENIFSEQSKFCTVGKILSDRHLVGKVSKSNEEYEEINEEFDINKMHWRTSKKELLRYNDYLASKLLEVWDVDQMEEWVDNVEDGKSSELSSEDEEDLTERVCKWLETQSEDFIEKK